MPLTFKNRFDWITSPELADTFRREIIHYFNLLITREVIHTLNILVEQEAQKAYWGYGLSQERALRDFVSRHLEQEPTFRMQGVSFLQQTLEAIEREMFNTHSMMMKELSISATLPTTFLGDLSDLLCRIMPRFQEKKITFLIDDYSTPSIARGCSAGSESSHLGTPPNSYFQTLFRKAWRRTHGPVRRFSGFGKGHG